MLAATTVNDVIEQVTSWLPWTWAEQTATVLLWMMLLGGLSVYPLAVWLGLVTVGSQGRSRMSSTAMTVAFIGITVVVPALVVVLLLTTKTP